MSFYSFFAAFAEALCGNIFVKLLAIAICADMVFSSLRAAKYRRWNSAVGIDGGIRKVGMVAGVLLLTTVDMLLNLDLINLVGDDVRRALSAAGIVKMGVTELFALLFILYECTSILKNMLLCGIPIPAGLRKKAVAWLESMTDETGAEFTEDSVAKQVRETLDAEQLQTWETEELLALAKDMGIECKGTIDKETLLQLITNAPVTIGE